MTEPPDQPKKPSKPGKRRHPPLRTERFVGEWSDVVWLKPMKPLAAEPEAEPPSSQDEKSDET